MRFLRLVTLLGILSCVISFMGVFKASSRLRVRLKETMNTIAPFDCIEGAATLEGPVGFDITPSKTDEEAQISFTLYGEPIALARHRTVSGGLRTYNPSAADQKKFAKACVTAEVLPAEPLEGPIEACMTFYFQRPKHHFRTGKFAGQLKEGQDVWHNKKKDLDNLVKFVLDSLNALAYLDDGQVCSIKAAKFYTNTSDNPRTEISFRSLSHVSSIEPVSEAVVVAAVKEREEKPKLTKSKQGRKAVVKAAVKAAEVQTVVGPIKGHAEIFACSS